MDNISNEINNFSNSDNQESFIEKVFKVELLSNLIASFLLPEEKGPFFSANKKLHSFYRNSIKELKSHIILKSPQIIDRFLYLQKIEICGRKSVDFSFLKKPKNLEQLKLKEVSVKDISVLSNLTGLKSLILITNKITDISFIKNLTKLSFLDLSNNKIINIDYLKYLQFLKSLSLQNCGLTDLDILKCQNFENLEKLSIGMNQIKNYSFLANLKNLIKLNLYQNQLFSIDFLIELNGDKITELNLGGNKIIDYSVLVKFKNIKKLNLYNNNIMNIDFLNNDSFSNLEDLDIGCNRNIKDFTSITNLKSLKKINLYECNLENIDFLVKENLELLEYIELENNYMEDFSILSFLKNLKYLSLKCSNFNWLNTCQFMDVITELKLTNKNPNLPNQNVYQYGIPIMDIDDNEQQIIISSSIENLKNLTNIKILNLSGWNFEAISFLKNDNFYNLEKLNLSSNKIRNAYPIGLLKKIKILNLKDNKIEDIFFLNEKLIIEEINLKGNKIKDISPLLKLPKIEIINIQYQKLKLEKGDKSVSDNLKGEIKIEEVTENNYNFYDNYPIINAKEKMFFNEIIDKIKKKEIKCLCNQKFLSIKE